MCALYHTGRSMFESIVLSINVCACLLGSVRKNKEYREIVLEKFSISEIYWSLQSNSYEPLQRRPRTPNKASRITDKATAHSFFVHCSSSDGVFVFGVVRVAFVCSMETKRENY